MTHVKENFLVWLREAHAMEEQAITLMSTQARRIENYPDLKQRLAQHLTETEGHARAIKALLDQFAGAGGVSVLKGMAAKLSGKAHGVGGMLISDEVVKAAMAGYAFEHLEIATYTVLIAVADELGELEAKAVFEGILAEEVAMAKWLEDNLDDITRIFLMRDERDLLAKR